MGRSLTTTLLRIVHQLNDPLTSICFILRGRLKAVRVDSRGEEQLFQIFERGDQYGMMLGGLGESIPVRIFALEPSTILSLDHEKSMDLVLLHPDLRRQWLRSYARSLRRRFLEPDAGQAPKVLAMLHQSPATRNLAQKIIGRLQGLGEAVSVLSDADSWRSIPNVRFRSLLDGNRLIEVAEIRRQMAEWIQAKRIVVDITAAQNLDWAVLLRPADCALVFIRPREIGPAIERLRALDLASQGWRDKIAIVWLLEEGSGVAPVVPELRDFASREFKICESPLPHPWGKVHSASMERLVHYLRGVRIGMALGGGAARGMAHLGVLNVLDQNGIVVDVIAGTSVGAMTGVLYSAGLDCDYLSSQFAADLKLPWIFRQLPSGGYWYLLYKYRRGQFDPMLRKYLRDWKLEQLAVPCFAVTADLVKWASGGSGSGRRRASDSRKHQLAYAFVPHLPERTGAGRWRGDEQYSRGCAYVSGLQLRDRRERHGQDRKAVWRQQAGYTHAQHANSVKPANAAPHPGSAECQPQRHRRPTGGGGDRARSRRFRPVGVHARKGTFCGRRTGRARSDPENPTTDGPARSGAF